MTHYHDMSSCNACGTGENDIKPKATDNGYVSEAETTCRSCGHVDYWAYGWFESGSEIVSKCKTYTNGSRCVSAKTENL